MVEHIGKEAFQTSGLKSAAFPKSPREVSTHAFSNCEQLRSVVLPDGVTKVRSDRFMESRIESMMCLQVFGSLRRWRSSAASVFAK